MKFGLLRIHSPISFLCVKNILQKKKFFLRLSWRHARFYIIILMFHVKPTACKANGRTGAAVRPTVIPEKNVPIFFSSQAAAVLKQQQKITYRALLSFANSP